MLGVQTMKASDFLKVVTDNLALLSEKVAPPGVDSCSSCGIPLQETVTGNRPYGPDQHVCSDCYFDELGREIEQHPISSRGITH